MRSYMKVHVEIVIKAHIIIIHGITCVSNDIIDGVIKFQNNRFEAKTCQHVKI